MKWKRGQRVIRDMGVAGGHILGTVVRIPGDRIFPEGDKCGHCERNDPDPSHHVDMNARQRKGTIAILCGKDKRTGITFTFDANDRYLKPAPDDLSEVAHHDRARRAQSINLDEPLFPEDYFK